MKKLMVASALALGLFVITSPVQAHGLRGDCCETGHAAPCATEYVETTVTRYKVEWKEKEIECVVNRMIPHDEVRQYTCTVRVPEWTEQKRTITEYKRVARVVEREVVVCKRVPCESSCESACDDGCGPRLRLFGRRGDGCEAPCNYTTEVKKVKCTAYDCVPVKRDITIKVCHFRQELKTFERKCTVYECKTETVKRMVKYCVCVPYEAKVKVPVCAPACPDGCARERCGRSRLHLGCRSSCCS